MKRKCKTCDHNCHCYGNGYNVSTNKCESCICDNCTCKPLVIKEEPEKKSWWKKFLNWWAGI